MIFTNYSQTYASQILALVGFVEIIGKQFGWPIAENNLVFVFGVLANVGGIFWALYHRHTKGDVSPMGVRK